METVKEYRNLIKDTNTYDELYRAFMYYAMICCSYGGKAYSTPTDYNYTNFIIKSIDKDILRIKYTLSKSTILSKDYKLLNPHNMFVYADPPYADVSNNTYYGDNGKNHKFFNHEEFHQFIETVAKDNLVMISYEDSQYIRNLYSGWKFIELSEKKTVKYNAQEDTNESISTPELLIINYDIFENDFEQMTFDGF